MIRIFLVVLSFFLTACGSQQARDEPNEKQLSDSIGVVELIKSRSGPVEGRVLDIGIEKFTVEQENTGPAKVGDWIFQEILDIESQYLPSLLRNTLVESNQWGAVRVLPKRDPSIDLQLKGTIYTSDGTFLKIGVQVQDSTGKLWLDKQYAEYYDGTTELRPNRQRQTNPNYRSEYEDPFQNLYNQIANDLLRVQENISDEEILNINRVTEMTYATDLSPETFSDTLNVNETGNIRVVRLLADNDPMLERVERMRLRHHVFIDTLDEYYTALQADMQATYDLWRVYSREQILQVEAEERSVDASKGGFLAISNNYYKYTANKIFEQEWNELAQGFTNEVAPAILDLNNQVYGLSGSVEDQYDEWRELLRQFYIQERGAF